MTYNIEQIQVYKSSHSAKNRFLRGLWCICYILFFRYSPRIGFNFWRLFLLRCFGASVHSKSKVYPTVKIWAPWNLTLGARACLSDFVDCYCVGKITIGNNVAISQRAFLCTASHKIDQLNKPLISKDIVILDHVWVCAEAYIGMGTTLAEGSVVGARAVVISDAEAWTVVAGNPAKFIKKRVIVESSE
jgi:putative colanic acid biosynthesis acetyltransferase WcaF